MKRNLKRLLALFLAVVMVFCMFACDSDDDDDDDDDDKSSLGGLSGLGGLIDDDDKHVMIAPKPDNRVTIQVGLQSSAQVTSFEDNALTKWLEETTGYNLEIVEYSGSTDIATQISTTIAARQNLPDILWGVDLDPATLTVYGKEGYVLDLKDYYNDKNGAAKNFWTRMDECLTKDQQAYVLSKLTDPDTGGMYGVPTVNTSLADGLDFMVWINTEWLDKLGLPKPTNTDELYVVLKAFSENDCNGNGNPDDEIPLMGSQAASNPAQVVNWLINLFMYYNDDQLWQDYNSDGQIEAAYTQDSYREALKFINKLYEEGLLTKMLYTANSNDMRQITTPNMRAALCGIFCGDIFADAESTSSTLKHYTSLKTWGCATENSVDVSVNCFITETAYKRDVVDECFNLLMTMWSWDGAMRIRYGEYGVNWEMPDEGARSLYGLAATHKQLEDPRTRQNGAFWGDANGTLNQYGFTETIQSSSNIDSSIALPYEMLAEARSNFDRAAAQNNPRFIPNPLGLSSVLNSSEAKTVRIYEKTVAESVSLSTKNFITGANDMDINNDAHWNAYLTRLDRAGYDELRDAYQQCYERQQ